MNEDKQPILRGGIGEMKSNDNTQWFLQDRIYDSKGIAVSLSTRLNPYYLIYEKNKNISD